MHIAIASSGLGHVQRGIEAWAKTLAEGLWREGEDAVLYAGGGRTAHDVSRMAKRGQGSDQSSVFSAEAAEGGKWKVERDAQVGLALPSGEDRPEESPVESEGPRSTSHVPRPTGFPGDAVPLVVLPCLRRSSLTARVLARCLPGFFWRWGWKSAYGIEQVTFARALLRAVRGNVPAIVHTQDVWLARVLTRAIRKHRLPTAVILAHGTDEPLNELAELPILQHLSPHYEAEGRRAVPGARHFCVPNFVDTTSFAPADDRAVRERTRREWGVAAGATVVGTAAAIRTGHKRMDVMIREVRRLRDAGHSVHLALAGAATAETPAVRRIARELLGDGCTIREDLPFDAMPSFYRALDVYVHPASEEVFGICLLEAMACGVPVVAHDSPTLKWVVGAGGWTTDVTRDGFLAGLWGPVAQEAPERGCAGREHVQIRFSWEAVYPQFKAMYEAVGHPMIG